MDDLISVIVSAYNVSKFIEPVIHSVLNQTYRNIEIIVVDDCSTDDTAAKLAGFRDKIRVVRHGKNSGASAARNTGIDRSRGGVVAFLDGDDKWAPRKLEIFAESLSGHEKVLFAFSDFSRFEWGDGGFFALSNTQIFPFLYDTIQRQKYYDRKYFVIPKPDMFQLLLRGYPPAPSTMVVRKRIFDLIGTWREDLRTNEDFDFSLRSSRVTDCIYIDELLTLVGRHASNLTRDFHRHMENDLSVFSLHLNDAGYDEKELEMIRYYYGRKLCGLGHHYLYAGNRKDAVRVYGEALRYRKWFWHALLRIGYIAVGGRSRERGPVE